MMRRNRRIVPDRFVSYDWFVNALLATSQTCASSRAQVPFMPEAIPPTSSSRPPVVAVHEATGMVGKQSCPPRSTCERSLAPR